MTLCDAHVQTVDALKRIEAKIDTCQAGITKMETELLASATAADKAKGAEPDIQASISFGDAAWKKLVVKLGWGILLLLGGAGGYSIVKIQPSAQIQMQAPAAEAPEAPLAVPTASASNSRP